jgi:hypothetical protein
MVESRLSPAKTLDAPRIPAAGALDAATMKYPG